MERHALAGEYFADLARALTIDADADTDGAVRVIQPGKRTTLHHRAARQGAQDRHAKRREGLRRHALLAAANARAHAVHDRAALDHDQRVARVDGLEVPIADPLLIDDLNAAALERGHKRVVLRLHRRDVGRVLALEVPVLSEVAVRADRLDALGRIDDLHLDTGPVHEDGADLADVIRQTPDTSPGRLHLGRVLVRRIAADGEHLDRLVVDPRRVHRLAHRSSRRRVVEAYATATGGERVARILTVIAKQRCADHHTPCPCVTSRLRRTRACRVVFAPRWQQRPALLAQW